MVLADQLARIRVLAAHLPHYLAETEEIEKKQGNWYIEEMPDFWIRFQTNNLEYGKNAQLESDGINFMDYAPESKSVLKISRESLKSDPEIRHFFYIPVSLFLFYLFRL